MLFKWEIFFDEVSQFLIPGIRFDGKKVLIGWEMKSHDKVGEFVVIIEK